MLLGFNLVLRLIYLVLTLHFVASCTSAEQKIAIEKYEKALAVQDLSAITSALKTLSNLAPEQYQQDFQLASVASQAITRAENYQLQNDIYQLYLAAHESFRAYPVKINKALLIESGKKLQWLIDVEKYVQKSIELLPEDMLAINDYYQQQKLIDWDLIKVNTLIEHLGKSAQFLERSLIILDKNKGMLPISVGNLLMENIKVQYEKVTSQQRAIIDIALHGSAIRLNELNDQLERQGSLLLSQVESRFAVTEMKGIAQKAENSFALFELLIENLSLASAMKSGNEHALWYQSWRKIQQPVFQINDSIEDYLENYQQRKLGVTRFTNSSRLDVPKLWHDQWGDIISSNSAAKALFQKLNKDKTLISYGLSQI